MIEFLAFGTFWFWSLLILFSGLLLLYIIFHFAEDYEVSTIWILGVFIALIFTFGGTVKIWDILAKPEEVLVYILGYIGTGLGWSFFEWYRLVNNKAAELIKDIRQDLSIEKQKEYIRINLPRVSAYWKQITVWILYFPYFILSWILTDPIKFIATKFRFIYYMISKFVENKTLSKLK